jgi:hypothetical protein
MRTTLNLDGHVLELLKDYAQSRSVALGRAVSELVRRGLAAPVQTPLVNGFHTVVLPANSPKVSSQKVKELRDGEI